MSQPLELAEKLLARTASSFIEEARTSALFLAELIRKHGFRIVDPKQLPPPRPRPTVYDPPAEWVLITSKFDGACKHCRCEHEEGDRIAWKKGYGVICLRCWTRRRTA